MSHMSISSGVILLCVILSCAMQSVTLLPSTLRVMQAGKGSATLSMAYAAAKFAESCLKALQGEPGVIECAYVSSHLTELPFFASPLRLDQNGVAVSLLSVMMHNLLTIARLSLCCLFAG